MAKKSFNLDDYSAIPSPASEPEQQKVTKPVKKSGSKKAQKKPLYAAEQRSQRIDIRIQPSLAEAAKELAASRKQTVSQLIITLIEKELLSDE